MAGFSASDAAVEGFQVLARNWRVAVGWCLFCVVGFAALVAFAFVAILVTSLAIAATDLATTAGGVIGTVIIGAGALAIQLMVVTALYRLMLRPGETPGLYYLRISREEVRLLGLWLVLIAAATALVVAAYQLVGALGVLGWPGRVGGAFVAACAILWLAMRLSLAGPANLAAGRFGLADSWQLTRGRVWPLLGATLIAACLFVLVAVVVWIATFVIQAAIGGFHSLAPVDLSDPQAFAERPGAYAFGLLAELALGPVFWVIAAAPFAAIYRALSSDIPPL